MTDHKPLTFALQQKWDKASPRQFRHLDLISQYTSDIRYVPRVNNIPADMLSRIEAISEFSALDYEQLARSQEDDVELQTLLSNGDSSGLVLKKIYQRQYHAAVFCDISTTNSRPYITQPFRR